MLGTEQQEKEKRYKRKNKNKPTNITSEKTVVGS